MTDIKCKTCGATVKALDVFPGGICLPCYRPIGEAKARTMTTDKLVSMWTGAH